VEEHEERSVAQGGVRSSGGTDHSTASSSRAGISLMRFILASAADTGDADTGDAAPGPPTPGPPRRDPGDRVYEAWPSAPDPDPADRDDDGARRGNPLGDGSFSSPAPRNAANPGWLSDVELAEARGVAADPLCRSRAGPHRRHGPGDAGRCALRATPLGEITRSIVGARALRRDGARRPLPPPRERPRPDGLPLLPPQPVPFTVAEYFPMPGVTAFHDDRQHAVSLAFVVPVTGTCEPRQDALEVTWMSPEEAASTRSRPRWRVAVRPSCARHWPPSARCAEGLGCRAAPSSSTSPSLCRSPSWSPSSPGSSGASSARDGTSAFAVMTIVSTLGLSVGLFAGWFIFGLRLWMPVSLLIAVGTSIDCRSSHPGSRSRGAMRRSTSRRSSARASDRVEFKETALERGGEEGRADGAGRREDGRRVPQQRGRHARDRRR
jgi:hypothetical protein